MDQTGCSSTFSSNLITQEAGKERKWAELPFDIISLIYQKLGSIEVLKSAQAVCRPWRQLSYEPSLWRCIHLHFNLHSIGNAGIVCKAVDHSGGSVEELYIENMDPSRRFIMSRTLLDINVRTANLRCLALISSPYTPEGELAEFIQGCPLLEEVEINNCCFGTDAYASIALSCPKLKRFRLNENINCGYGSEDLVALEIADSMPNLHELQLVFNKMTNKGLHAILDKCIHLEKLEIRKSYNVRFTKRIREKLAKINIVFFTKDEWGTKEESEDETDDSDCYE